MELEVLKITGESTGRKVQLNENIYGIEPNDHCIYLDTKQYLADQRQGTHKAKTRSENQAAHASCSVRRVQAVHVVVTSNHQC